MVSPHASSHAHEHEFEPERVDCLYEDGAVHLTAHCIYVEQRSAGTSKRLDETFYETVYECEHAKHVRYDLTELAVVYDDDERTVQTLESGENVFEFSDNLSTTFLEEIESDAAERLCADAETYPEALDWVSYDDIDSGPHYVELRHDGTQYRLTYEQTEVSAV